MGISSYLDNIETIYAVYKFVEKMHCFLLTFIVSYGKILISRKRETCLSQRHVSRPSIKSTKRKALISMYNNITPTYDCQVNRIFEKLYAKKSANKKVIEFLENEACKNSGNPWGESAYLKSLHLRECATQIGISNIEGIAHVVKADFCRERICNVCAWRRQAKFVSQTRPVLNILSNKGYRFIFVTLTIQNMPFEELNQALDLIMSAFHKFVMRRQIKRAFKGIIRSVELTYNEKKDTFHPHIHMLVAVESDYFSHSGFYTTHETITELWREALGVDYTPIVHVESVDDTEKAQLETLKYSLKPSQNEKALKVFLYVLRGRRLISFSGVFAKLRKELMLSDFEDNLLDDVKQESKKVFYDLYRLDSTGGIYKFYERFEL